MSWLSKFEDIVCVFSLLIASFLIFINVVLRYAFHSGFPWSEELIRYLFAIVTFIGLSMGVKRNSRISIDIVALSMKSDSAKKVVELGINLTQLLFAFILAVIAFRYTKFVFNSGQVSSALELPIFYLYLLVTIAFVLLAISTLSIISKLWHSKGVK